MKVLVAITAAVCTRAAAGGLLVRRGPSWVSRSTDAQWVFGEGKTDTALTIAAVRPRQSTAIQLSQGDRCMCHILKLYKTHWSMVVARQTQTQARRLVLCAERQAAEPFLWREQSTELRLSGIWGQVADIQRVARRVLVRRVGWRWHTGQQR